MLLLCNPDSEVCSELRQLLEELKGQAVEQLPTTQQDTGACRSLRIGDVMNSEPSEELREIITRVDAIKKLL